MDKPRESGTIIKGIGGNYQVDCGGQIRLCKASGRLRLAERGPVVGDRAEVEIDTTDGSGYIVALQDRKSLLVRPSVANIDMLVILASSVPPVTDPYLIDKISVIALWQGIEPVIVINKCDLDTGDSLYDTYQAVGFKVLRVSAVTGQGIDMLYSMLEGKIAAFTGNSGIGKSSVLNRLDSRFQLTVGGMSQKIGRGKNTTRHVELLRLANGGLVADTPGFSSFDITKMEHIPKEMLAGLFPEIAKLFGQCRFSDCVHINEPGCAVLDATEADSRLVTRHKSYVKMYEELEQINEWELPNEPQA